MNKPSEERQPAGLILRKDLSLLVWSGEAAVDIQLTKIQAIELSQMLLVNADLQKGPITDEKRH